MSSTETERQCLGRLRAARQRVSDEALLGLFTSIESNLQAAADAVELSRLASSRAGLTSGCIKERNENHCRVPGVWMSAKRIEALKEMADMLAGHSEPVDGTDHHGLITAWQSDKECRRAREAATGGDLRVLCELQASRSKWPAYLTMASWDEADHHGYTPLILAAQKGHCECVEALLDWGADPTKHNASGETALHLAASAGMARALLAHGSDPAALDRLDRTPYMVHRSNRMGGAKSEAGQVASAFAEHQQITASAARAINRSRRQLMAATAQKETDERAAAADVHYQEGLSRMLRKEWRAAIAAFTACLDVEPSHLKASKSIVEAWNFVIDQCYNRGLGAAAMTQWDNACTAFEACIAAIEEQQRFQSKLITDNNDTQQTPAAPQQQQQHPKAAQAATKLAKAQESAAQASLEMEALGVFNSLDTDGDGTLSPQELSCRLSDFGLGDQEIEGLLWRLDTNHDGVVDRDEWVAGYKEYCDVIGCGATTAVSAAVVQGTAGKSPKPPWQKQQLSPPVTPEEGTTRASAATAV